MRIRMRLEFDGSAFCGWQLQSAVEELKLRSGQGALETAVATSLRKHERFVVQGCGRTDAGTHAEEFFAHVDVPQAEGWPETELERFRHSLNCLLPPQMAITEVAPAPAGFHALDSVVRKAYEYRLLLRRVKPVLLQGRCHWLPRELKDFDVALVRRALQRMQGTHDFLAFASAHHTAKTTVRTLFKAELRDDVMWEREASGHLLTFRFEGDGFLRHMVRNLMGTLVEIGTGERPLDSLEALLPLEGQPAPRTAAGPCLPAEGLFLVRVQYE